MPKKIKVISAEEAVKKIDNLSGFLFHADASELELWYNNLDEGDKERVLEALKVLESFATDGQI